MPTQLSFMKDFFPCASTICQSKGEVMYKVTTTFYPNGKGQQSGWVSTEILCKDCVEKLQKQMKDNPFIAEYNDIKFEEIN